MIGPIVVPIPDHPMLTDAARHTIAGLATALTRCVLDGKDFHPMIVQPGHALTAVMSYDDDEITRASQTFMAGLALHDRIHPDEAVWCADAYASYLPVDATEFVPPAEDPRATDALLLGYVRIFEDDVLNMYSSMPYHRDDEGTIVWDMPMKWWPSKPETATAMESALVCGVTGMPIDTAPPADLLGFFGVTLIERPGGSTW